MVPMAIYHTSLLVIIGMSDKEVEEVLLQYEGFDRGSKEMKKSAGWRFDNCKKVGHVTRFDNNAMLLRLREYPTTPEDYGIIAHEVFHVVELLFERVGMPLADSSSEAYAYLIGYVTQEIFKQLK